MTQPQPISPASLLAHEPFVRAVVRDLLRDEHGVQDVVQETWIRALSRGPASDGSLKGWLARVARRLAIDRHRESDRRGRRERESARPESLESVDALHARLEAQREVVDAVLALEEPYQSVVLLAYYERLDSAQIGARLGRSPATVRSQLTRAHEILRRKLDAHHGGDRGAWAGVLLPWAVATKSKVGVAVAAGIGIALLGAGAWMLPRSSATTTQKPVELAVTTPDPTAPPASSVVAATSAPSREALAQPAVVAALVERPDLSKLGRDELRDLAVQAMRTLEKKLVTPDVSILAEQGALLALPDSGVTRLYARNEDGSFPYEGLVLGRSGASYYSFATRTHDYNREPDIGYEAYGTLGFCFYGTAFGAVVSIGRVDLASLTPESATPYPLLMVHPAEFGEATMRPLQRAAQELTPAPCRPEVGETLLIRTISPDEHDQLVAVRILQKDDASLTIAWRVLQRNPCPGTRQRRLRVPDFPGVGPAPQWIESLSIEQLGDLIREIRVRATPLLPSVSEDISSSNAWRIRGASRAGFIRTSEDEQLIPLLDRRDDTSVVGCDRTRFPDQCWAFGVGGWGIQGVMQVDLGEISESAYAELAAGAIPAALSSELSEAARYLAEEPLEARGSGRVRALGTEQEARMPRILRNYSMPKVGHSYLIRAGGREDGSDHLLLVSVLEHSREGTSFSWRELKRFD